MLQLKDLLNLKNKVVTELTFEMPRAFIQKIIVIDREHIIFCVVSSKGTTDADVIRERKEIINYPSISSGKVYNKAGTKFVNYEVVTV